MTKSLKIKTLEDNLQTAQDELSIISNFYKTVIDMRTNALNMARHEAIATKPADWKHTRKGKEYKPVIGYHECDTSPIGVCVYDRNGYNGDDECVFCHDPEERK